MKLSIVSTLYQSAPYIVEFHKRVSTTARELVGNDYEIVLVNDGSPDNSLDLAVKLTEDDPHLVLVDLARNFGHHKAIMTGLAHAAGEKIFLLDSDLEEEPEWLLIFDEQFRQEAVDVIYGVQQQRKGNWFERLSGQWFYILFNWFSGLNLPANLVTARLMSRRYIDALLKHQEREFLIAGLWHITGFNQKPHYVRKVSHSPTTYTLYRKISLLINAITSFSSKPLIGIFYIGALISAAALLYIFYLFLNYFFLAEPLGGWTSVMGSIWLLSGMIIFFIGVIGIYLSKVFLETKRRPYVIVKDIYKNNDTDLMLEVANYYSEKLNEYGVTPRGVDWNGPDSQRLRFEQICRVIKSQSDDFSLNDLGCGYGALLDYLDERWKNFSYTGVDVSESMIHAAQLQHPSHRTARFIVSAKPDMIADYSVASGIFNVRQKRSDVEWLEYLKMTINLLDKTSRFGFAFNCLTSYSDEDKKRDYLYYADPCQLFHFCKCYYSRQVSLLHDYGLYEFTILVRK